MRPSRLDIRQRAADEELTRRTDREVVSRGIPERTPEALAAIRSDIEDEFPDLAEAAESGEYTRAGTENAALAA